jgi:hypothetical protein
VVSFCQEIVLRYGSIRRQLVSTLIAISIDDRGVSAAFPSVTRSRALKESLGGLSMRTAEERGGGPLWFAVANRSRYAEGGSCR